MKIICRLMLIATFIGCVILSRTAQASPDSKAATPVFREPFTLKLRVDNEHFYEQEFTKRIPFVANNNVYLFAGESFGLKLAMSNGKIATVSYQKEKNGADIELTFKQETQKDGRTMMMLTLKSNIKQTLYLDALMVVLDRKKPLETSIMPVAPGLTGFETWPHPILQLVLTDLRLHENTSADGTRKRAGATQKR
jgi:hypothetical protein